MDGIICINKPQGFTSFDVVAKCRGITSERKMGHGGTLDPMATGVLPLFLGGATSAADITYNQKKGYLAGIQLGIATDTYDVTGTVLSQADASGFRAADIAALLPAFRGEISQTPPMYSAVQVDGQRLYKLARQGKTVEVPSRQVVIDEISAYDEDGRIYLNIVCSKGTYIRSIIHDLGQRLGCGAAMSSLCRTMSCGFTLADCVSMEQLQQSRSDGEPERYLMPVSRAFAGMPTQEVADENLRKYINGVAVEPCIGEPHFYAVQCCGVFLGIGEVTEDGLLHPRKLFVDPVEALTWC